MADEDDGRNCSAKIHSAGRKTKRIKHEHSSVTEVQETQVAATASHRRRRQQQPQQNRMPISDFGVGSSLQQIYYSRKERVNLGLWDDTRLGGGPEAVFARKESQNYFLWEKDNRVENYGPTMITFLSQEKETNETKMSPNEILFHLGVAEFAQKHSLSTSANVADSMLRYINEYISELKNERDTWKKLALDSRGDSNAFFKRKKQLLQRHSLDWQTQMPTTITEIRRWYVDGTHCMHGNMPHPAVEMPDDGHAYVSISECISHMFLHMGHYHSVDMTVTDPDPEMTKSIHYCPMAQSMYQQEDFAEQNTIHLHLCEWSDDFEPSSGIKAGRGSIWAKVVSLVCTCSKHKNSPLNSFCIALGSKGDDHSIIEEKFAAELKILSNKGIDVWHKALNRQVIVKARLLFSIQDQPERRSAIGISNGNSNNTARFGYCYNVKQNQNMLKPCDDCLLRLFKKEKPIECKNCFNWEFVTENADGSRSNTKAAEMTFDVLVKATKYTNNQLLQGEWTAKQADTYLDQNGIVHKVRSKIVDQAVNKRSLVEAMAKASSKDATEKDKQAYEILQISATSNPDRYKLYEGPHTWYRQFMLCQHVDAPMHLIFLGIVRRCTRWIARWAVSQGVGTAFFKHYTPTFEKEAEEIQRLSLCWCKNRVYIGGKLGGWISESYVAHARLFPWFYGWLDRLTKLNRSENLTKHVEPTGPVENWCKTPCSQWLRNRGEKVTKTELVGDLRKRIKVLKEQPGGPPKVVPPIECAAGKVIKMLHALHAMIALLMSRDEPSPDQVDEVTRRTKLFLTLFARCDQDFHTGVGSDLHTWVSSYNFTTLLNLPRVIALFKTLRDLWEGGFAGEGSVRFIKLVAAKLGRAHRWPLHMLKTLHQNRAFTDIRRQLDHTVQDDERKHGNDFYCYNAHWPAQAKFLKKLPLSVVMCEREFYMVTRKKGNRLLCVVQLTRKAMYGTKAGLSYFEWECASKEQPAPDHQDSTSYCLFLPLPSERPISGRSTLEDEENKTYVYAVVSSDWKQLDKNGNLTMPETPHHDECADLIVGDDIGSSNVANSEVDQTEVSIIEESIVELMEDDSDSDDDYGE